MKITTSSSFLPVLLVTTLLVCLFFADAQAIDNDFTGATSNNWFVDGNWSELHVPLASEDVRIVGFDVHAYMAAGDTLRGSTLRLASWTTGPGSASIYSERPLDFDNIDIAQATLGTGGDFSGALTVVGADVNLEGWLDIAYARGGAGYTAEGHVTITNGSLYLPGSIQLADARDGGVSTASLTVTNGNIIGTGNDGLYCGETSSATNASSESSFRLENGRLEGVTDGYFGYAYGDGTSTHCDVNLIKAACLFEGDTYTAYGSSSTCEFILDNAYFRAPYLEVGDGTTFQLHIDGTKRAAEGNISTSGKYSAIDLNDDYGVEFEGDARLELHFGYMPANGDSYDLIKNPVGQTFDGMFTEIVVVGLPQGFEAQHEIIPGDTENGEILRVTVTGSATPIPAMSTWGLLIGGILLVSAGSVLIRKRAAA